MICGFDIFTDWIRLNATHILRCDLHKWAQHCFSKCKSIWFLFAINLMQTFIRKYTFYDLISYKFIPIKYRCVIIWLLPIIKLRYIKMRWKLSKYKHEYIQFDVLISLIDLSIYERSLCILSTIKYGKQSFSYI